MDLRVCLMNLLWRDISNGVVVGRWIALTIGQRAWEIGITLWMNNGQLSKITETIDW